MGSLCNMAARRRGKGTGCHPRCQQISTDVRSMTTAEADWTPDRRRIRNIPHSGHCSFVLTTVTRGTNAHLPQARHNFLSFTVNHKTPSPISSPTTPSSWSTSTSGLIIPRSNKLREFDVVQHDTDALFCAVCLYCCLCIRSVIGACQLAWI